MTLTVTRSDHGAFKDGNFACLVRVSTDEQDVANQEAAIKAWLNGGEHKIKWFREEDVSSGEEWHNRKTLHQCLDYCRKHDATLVLYSLDRLSRYQWQTLRFFEQEVMNGKIKLVVVDDPTLDELTISIKSAFAQQERKRIKARTQMTLDRINAEIKEKGSYVTKEGRTITKLGAPSIMETRFKGYDRQREKFQERADKVAPILEAMIERGLSLREMARELNRMSIATPTKMRKPDLSKRTEWHASSVRNYIKRMKP